MIDSEHDVTSDLEEKFQILEEKVFQAVKKIQILESEKSKLLQDLQNVEQQIEDMQSKLQTSEKALLEAEKWKDQVQELTQVKQFVAGKIEGLLNQINRIPLNDL
ncbi:hypothetical protein JW979_14960 [bacterium]|nr:hypothetical protein [candidate division CSSED10-310 bacterium]